MLLRKILREIQQPTSQHFDTYSKNNKYGLKLCRMLCRKNGYDLNGQTDDEFFHKFGKLMTIPISKLNVGQDHIETKVVDNKDVDDYKPIFVFEKEGRLFLHDGHHRTVNLINHDIDTVKGYVVSVNKFLEKEK